MEEALYMLGSLAAVSLVAIHAIKAWSGRQHERDRTDPTDGRGIDELRQELLGELRALREEHAAAVEDLYERVEFAERLLTQGRRDVQDAREPTPV